MVKTSIIIEVMHIIIYLLRREPPKTDHSV